MDLLESQTTIRLLSYLVRLDRLFTEISYSRLTDVPLTKEDYSFIYRYIDYFDLLAYKKTANTTALEKLIKERLKSFPLVKAMYEQILGIEERINQTAIFHKKTNV